MFKSIVVSLVLASLVAAQAPQGQPQSLKGVVRFNRVPVSKEVLKVNFPRPVERQLSNGLKLLVLESHRLPTISLRISIPAGDLRDPASQTGLSTATAALIQLGTKTRSSKDIADSLAEIGASLGVGSGEDSGSIMLSALTENFDAALVILTDILLNPTFPQDELDKWKTRTRASIEQSKGQPGALASERMYKLLYPSDGRQHTRPTDESLNAITRDNIVEFYKKYYVPSGRWAGIAGDVTPRDAMAKIEKALGSWKGGPLERISLPLPAPLPEKKVYLISRPNSVQTYFVIANRAINRLDPDYFSCTVMNRVLGNGPTSRLFRNIREEKGYTYGIGSSLSATRVLNFFQVSTSVRTEVTEQALAEILREFADIRQKPVPEDELADAKSAIVASFVLGLESSASVLGQWLIQREYGFPEDYLDTYPAKVMAVTAADIQRVAKKYVPLDNAQIIAVGDAAKIGEVMKKFGPVEDILPDKN
jgi:zinc protease